MIFTDRFALIKWGYTDRHLECIGVTLEARSILVLSLRLMALSSRADFCSGKESHPEKGSELDRPLRNLSCSQSSRKPVSCFSVTLRAVIDNIFAGLRQLLGSFKQRQWHDHFEDKTRRADLTQERQRNPNYSREQAWYADGRPSNRVSGTVECWFTD